MKLLRFLHSHSPYNGGELAGFPDADAEELVLRGIAEFVNEVPPPEVQAAGEVAELEAAAVPAEVEAKPSVLAQASARRAKRGA
jgi:hypothetical protein